jgi:methyl-accepting chemotaxis protein
MGEAQTGVLEVRQLAMQTILDTDVERMAGTKERQAEQRAIITDRINKYKQTNMTEEEKTALARLETARAGAVAVYDKVTQMGMANQNQAGFDFYMSPESRAAENEFLDSVNDILLLLTDISESTIAESEAMGAATVWTVSAVSVGSLVLGLALSLMIARTITSPMNRLRKNIEEFGSGDLRVVMEAETKDEVGVMGTTLQDMSNVLNGVIGTVNNTSHEILESAHEFSAMAEETNASVEEFRSNVDEMSGNMDNLAAASQEVNASVQEVAAGAQATAEKGTDIARKVDEAMAAGDDGIEAVRKVVRGVGVVAESSASATASAALVSTSTSASA